jgi:phosphatidylinositol kinase/protein kinase (PI-3  family)
MPLNEECGLLEWVAHTNAFKNILEEGYTRQGKRLYTSDLAVIVEQARKEGSRMQVEVFVNKILPM